MEDVEFKLPCNYLITKKDAKVAGWGSKNLFIIRR
jgi:hypothetical protein